MQRQRKRQASLYATDGRDRDAVEQAVVSRSWRRLTHHIPLGVCPSGELKALRAVVGEYVASACEDVRYRQDNGALDVDALCDDAKEKVDEYASLLAARLQTESTNAALYPIPGCAGELAGVARYVEISAATDCGKRRVNEDKYLVLPSLSAMQRGAVPSLPEDERKAHPLLATGSAESWVKATDVYAAVFDGHGGAAAATYARDHLHFNIANAASLHHDLCAAVKEGFAVTHADFAARAERQGDMSGTTACVAIVRGGTLLVANVGDTAAVLFGEGYAPRVLSEHHHASNPAEQALVRDRGGEIVDLGGVDRVDGQVTVTRAIGGCATAAHMTAEPHVSDAVPLLGRDKFVVIASDGLWDIMTPQEVGAFVSEVVTEIHAEVGASCLSMCGSDATADLVLGSSAPTTEHDCALSDASYTDLCDYSVIADALVAEAEARGATDNVTAAVLWFNHPSRMACFPTSFNSVMCARG
eukprot:TRINITY_DN6887_c0_g1_i1.p1 TRINITY_DN6887_c0_g1~~TRINITY_DN6887_c0_g1_i1.p1  ORF type:complete len:509 (+),score=143.35 TRINITY_DN6887_c0_g1_i1:109-1527(+)